MQLSKDNGGGETNRDTNTNPHVSISNIVAKYIRYKNYLFEKLKLLSSVGSYKLIRTIVFMCADDLSWGDFHEILMMRLNYIVWHESVKWVRASSQGIKMTGLPPSDSWLIYFSNYESHKHCGDSRGDRSYSTVFLHLYFESFFAPFFQFILYK